MYDMTIELQLNSDRCLYEQIYDHIRLEIREGRLLAGERLPSTRSLADYLQVARSTVEFAYEQLVSEGYIESRPYRGYFVCTLENVFQMREMDEKQTSARQNPTQVVAGKMREDATEKEGIEDREAVEKPKQDIQWDFSPNGIDMSSFPFSIWRKINKNIFNDNNQDLFAQGEPQGDFDLRQTICRYLYSSRGVNCSPEQIIVGAGNDYLLMLLEKILGRHVPIAMENPTYKRAYRIFQSFAYDIITVDMDEGGMEVEELRRKNARAAYVMPSHQFPTGVVMPIGRRMELLKWADEEEDRYLIEDDYDSEFRYRGKPIPCLQASDRAGKVIYIGTFSKAIAPAIRVSYMVLPRKLLSVYLEKCHFYSCTVSRIDQRILNEFIRDGYFERHLNKMRKVYRNKHDVLLECLKPFEQKFAISGEHAGLHLLLHANDNVKEEELLAKAASCGVKVYGLTDSMVVKSEERATLILGFGGLSIPEIIEGMKKLEQAWLS